MSREYFQFLRDLEKQNGLPAGLLSVQQQAESNFDPRAVSPAGAQGIAQFMPATAAEYGIDPFDPMQSAQAQAKMMGGLLKKYQGDVPSALAGYNWGQGNVDRKGLDNAPAETRKYIAKITSGLQNPQTITADAAIATPVQNMVALDGNTDPVPDMSDEELQAIADQGKNQDLLKQAEGLSDAQLEAIAKGGSDDMGDLLRAPGELVKGIGEGAVRAAGNASIGVGKAISELAQSTGIAPEWGANQQAQIGDFQRQFNAGAPDITQVDSASGLARWAGNIGGALPAYYAPLAMIGLGAVGGGADAAEKTKGDALGTLTGAAVGGAINAVPGRLLAAGKGIIPSTLAASAFGAVVPSATRLPEIVAGQNPSEITDNELINSVASSALMGGLAGRMGRQAETAQPSKADVEQGMTAAYKAVDNSGIVLKPDGSCRTR